MKKVYSKPEILFEDFTVTTTISAGCDKKVNSTENVCVVEFAPGMNLFTSDVGACDTPIADGSDDYGNDGLCYHVPEDYDLFTS